MLESVGTQASLPTTTEFALPDEEHEMIILFWPCLINQWIGFVGKILTGNHGFYHQI